MNIKQGDTVYIPARIVSERGMIEVEFHATHQKQTHWFYPSELLADPRANFICPAPPALTPEQVEVYRGARTCEFDVGRTMAAGETTIHYKPAIFHQFYTDADGDPRALIELPDETMESVSATSIRFTDGRARSILDAVKQTNKE